MNNGVEKKRITQEDCDIARFFMKRGKKIKDISEMLGVDASTVSKMKAGDFRLDQYLEIRKENNRKQAEKKALAQQKMMVIDLVPKAETPEMLAGQMQMDLKPAKPEAEAPEMSDQTKMMRFIAGQIDKVTTMNAVGMDALRIQIDRLNDTLCMILRAVRKE